VHKAHRKSVVAIPAIQAWLGVDRAAADVDLEVEVAADSAGVAGLADGADPLAGPNPVAVVDDRRADQVGVEIAAPLALAVDQQVVAVENRVVAGAQDTAGCRGKERRRGGNGECDRTRRSGRFSGAR
jgi:hypothetical protein